MLIVNVEALHDFSRKQPPARQPLERWILITEASKWNNLEDVKRSFNSVDYVRGKYVFNIKGNDYRLLAEIIFTAKTVLVIDVLTHREYDRLNL